MSALFSPLSLRDVTLANRIVVSPMCQYSAKNGLAGPWHKTHLGSLASSGASMLCIESTAVEPEGRITPGDLGLWSDETVAALQAVLDPIREYSKIAVTLQLGHAGRKASSHTPWEGGQLIPVSDGAGFPWPRRHLSKRRASRLPSCWTRPGSIVFASHLLPLRGVPRDWASTASKSTVPTATFFTSSSHRSRTIARTPMAALLETGCASRWRCSTPFELLSPPKNRSG